MWGLTILIVNTLAVQTYGIHSIVVKFGILVLGGSVKKSLILILVVLISAAMLYFKTDMLDSTNSTKHDIPASSPLKPDAEETISDLPRVEIPKTTSSYEASVENTLEEIWIDNTKETPVATYLTDIIKAAKEGNAAAKYHLSYIQRACNNIPINEDQLDSRISQIELESVKQHLIEDYIFCKGYPRNTLSIVNIRDFIMAAARAGISKAKLEFSAQAFAIFSPENTLANAELIVDLKQETVQHLLDAKSMGESSALIQLSMVYEYGELVDKDYILAYAYYYAYSLVTPQTSRAFLDTLGRDLTYDEKRMATLKGERYAQCCN